MDKRAIFILKRGIAQKYGYNLSKEQLFAFIKYKYPEIVEASNKVNSGNFDWNDLQLYSIFCRFYTEAKDHGDTLGQYDDCLDLPKFTNVSWVGHGFGGDSLNCYRSVVIKNRRFFEKIYRNNSDDLLNIKKFYNCEYQYLKNRAIKIPNIIKIVEGHKLTAIYFDCLNDLSNATRIQTLEGYRNFFSTAVDFLRNHSANDKSFVSHELYKEGKECALKIIGANNEAKFLQLEAEVTDSHVILSHGDWYHKNISGIGEIFDWDRYGYYPVGFDIGYCFSKSVKSNALSVAEKRVFEYLPQSLLRSYQRNFWYFCFIFYSRKVGRILSDNDLNSLFNKAYNHAQ